MTFTTERTPFRRQTAPGGVAVALGAVLALSLGAGEARAQAAVCTPTQAVSGAPDADGRYTTTLTCANTAAAPTAADYRHLHYNQEVYSETHSNVQYTNPADRDTGVANNAANNNLAFTVESGVVFTADGGADTKSVPRDGAIVLWGGGSKTVRIKRGATINLNRVMGPAGSTNYPHSYNDILNNFGGIYAESKTATGGDIAVLHEGKINVDITTNSGFAGFHSNTGGTIVAVIRDDNSETRVAADVRVDLASTGVIEQSAGSHGLGGIIASNQAEEGDVVVNLAKGSRVDLSVGGNPAVLVDVGSASSRARIIVNAAGTIKNRVPNVGGLSADVGLGIRTWNVGTGETRIESSGTIETVQASGIAARALNRGNKQRDDPATSRIEGNLIDVTSGQIVTRAGTAVSTRSDGPSVWTVRVAEGATVRSEFDGGPGAVPQATLGNSGNFRIHPGNIRSFRQIDANNDGNVGNAGDLLEPFVNAISIGRSPCDRRIPLKECVKRLPPKGVVDRVIVDGTAQTVGSRHGDAVIVFQLGFAAVTVGPTGRVISDSGSAISSGDPGQDAAKTGDLSVTVARGGQVTGDIRVVNDRDLDATVSGTVDGDIQARGDGDLDATVSGTVTGDIQALGDGHLNATVSGTVTGEIRTMGAGKLTVTVGPTGRVIPDSGIAIASGQTPAALQKATKGGLSVTVARGGQVTGDVRVLDDGNLDATVSGTVTGDLRTLGDGHLNATVSGTVTGEIRTMGAGNLTVTVAEGGRLAASALHTAGGDLKLTVAGRVTGDLRPPRHGALTLSVLEGGVVGGTVRDPRGPLTVAGHIGRLLYSNGGKVTIAATGALTGVEANGVTEALRSDAGALDVTVAGRVAGDLRPPTGGTLKLSVARGGVVEGTVHDPEGPLTVAGSIGRLLYSNGGEVTIAATGALTGVEANGGIEALRSENGVLRMTVAGRVTGDIFGLGDGEHDVTVRQGGTVTGAIRLAASTARVDGAAGAVFLDRGGEVTVGRGGRIAGVDGVGIHSAAGDFTGTVEGMVVGDIHALGGDRTVGILPGGVVTGNVYAPDRESAGAVAVLVAQNARVAGVVEVPRAENLGLNGAVGKVSAQRGGVLTIGPDGRVTGIAADGGIPEVSAGTGDLTVVIQLAPGETKVAALRRAPRRVDAASGTERVLFRMPDPDDRQEGNLQEIGTFESGRSTPSGPFDVGLAVDGSAVLVDYRPAPRGRVYEALPSVLLGLRELSGFGAWMEAPRLSDGTGARTQTASLGDAPTPRLWNGMWARTQAWGGARDAKRSKWSTSGEITPTSGGISLKYRGWGLEAGWTFPLDDTADMSVSAHRRQVAADVSGDDGDIDVVGNGVAASLTVDLADSVADGVYAGGRASATSYSARLSSGPRGSLQRDADGVGATVSLEAGRRMAWGEGALGEVTLTPRAGVRYSQVDMDAFTDSVGARVSLREAVAKTVRAGLRAETANRPASAVLFGSVDVEHEFAPETRVRVSGTDLESEAEATRVRVELGGAVGWGPLALQAAARYASGADDYGGGVSLRLRF